MNDCVRVFQFGTCSTESGIKVLLPTVGCKSIAAGRCSNIQSDAFYGAVLNRYNSLELDSPLCGRNCIYATSSVKQTSVDRIGLFISRFVNVQLNSEIHSFAYQVGFHGKLIWNPAESLVYDYFKQQPFLVKTSARHPTLTSSGISKSNFMPRHPVHLAAFNVRTLKQAGVQAALALVLDSLDIDAHCVAETSTAVELTAPSFFTRFRLCISGVPRAADLINRSKADRSQRNNMRRRQHRNSLKMVISGDGLDTSSDSSSGLLQRNHWKNPAGLYKILTPAYRLQEKSNVICPFSKAA
ncbi:polyprotein [Clonorchis sinensis]|uniref:Polyprotein n=1 Tax=Clonorchis sinensis TaxID=79923 RepID=G7YQ57_CLOSI|nr:polyprotein [Clonorchis sinensis]